MATSFTITLTEEEIAILRSALDSAEYWEHKDVLPHNSGYILDPEFMVSDPPEMNEEAREAWEEVKAIRALDERLAALDSYVGSHDDCPIEEEHTHPGITESEQRLLDGNR